MHFLQQYASFLLNTATIVVGIVIVLVTIFALASKNKRQDKGKLTISKLNKKYDELESLLNHTILSKKELKARQKQEKALAKKENKRSNDKKRIFVLHFKGDIRANQVSNFREEITAVLTVATEKDEVLVCLESPGGVVHGYGLAASQLLRIRERSIPLTIAVDKVAASGGYMMACVANKIIAAPFAIIGSIGVVLQLPNFNKLLSKHNIEFEQLTAGEYKRTLTMFGENTEKGREKMQEELEETQTLFKNFIEKNRPTVDLQEVATGEHWFATKAIEYKLVDELKTSDDYLMEARKTADLFEVKKSTKKTMLQKLGKAAQLSSDGLLTHWWQNRYNH